VSHRRPSIANILSRLSSGTKTLAVARRAYLQVRRLFAIFGFDLVYASYDSPIPHAADLVEGFFDRPSPMREVSFDPERQVSFVESELGSYCREFSPPLTSEEAGPNGFYLGNGTYESVDAELLYAMVRRSTPRRVVELGSGFSTLIIRAALERNAPGSAGEILRTYDPYRSALLAADVVVAPLRVQDVPDRVFEELTADDILFVDTSHTVKLGGDVNRIILDLLPLIRPGVIVHFHDIFLPYPYSRAHFDAAHFWTEQDLLQAFLAGNGGWEVVIGAYAVARAYPARLGAVVPSFGPGVAPGAIWLRRLP
jgi:predicted O-methyltransferase YrrM